MKLWIARQLNGDLIIFLYKPHFNSLFNKWVDDNGISMLIADRFDNKFHEVTFENSPKEVELKLI